VAQDRFGRAIDRGLQFLAASQRPNGEFPTYWSRTVTMDRPTAVASPFVTGMVLLALRDVSETEAIRERGLAHLRSWRRPDGTFAFFSAGIDPDLDDTCLLNWLLLQQEPKAFQYDALARCILALQRPDGLFPTWIRTDPMLPNPVDPCVNVNVLRFLDACGLPAPRLVAALQGELGTRPCGGTTYYHPHWSLIYLASSLPHPLRTAVLGAAPPALSGSGTNEQRPHDPLESALRLGVVAETRGDAAVGRRLATELLLFQRRSGTWPASAMFQAFNYWGSPELSTAIALAAITAFQRASP